MDLTQKYHRNREFSIINNAKIRNLTIGVNLLLLIELCVAMFFAAQDPENLTPVFFFSVFLPLLIPTIIGTIIAKRLIIKHKKRRNHAEHPFAPSTFPPARPPERFAFSSCRRWRYRCVTKPCPP